jgi:hypothetical protein
MTNDIVSELRQWGGTFGAKAADEIERLREELDKLKAKNAEISIKHEVACSTINLLQKKCNVRGEALMEQCKETKRLQEELAAINAQEPVAIFNGVVDCGEHGAFDLELLKMIPRGAKLYAAPVPSADAL